MVSRVLNQQCDGRTGIMCWEGEDSSRSGEFVAGVGGGESADDCEGDVTSGRGRMGGDGDDDCDDCDDCDGGGEDSDCEEGGGEGDSAACSGPERGPCCRCRLQWQTCPSSWSERRRFLLKRRYHVE